MAPTLDHAVVNSFLRGLPYPISREELIDLAQINKVPDNLVAALRGLPAKRFQSPQEVMDNLLEQRHHMG